MKKAFIGRIFFSLESAIKAYNKMSYTLRKHQRVVKLEENYFILGNSTIQALQRSCNCP